MSGESPQRTRPRRPIPVWLITIYYGFDFAWRAFNITLFQIGVGVNLSDVQRAYLAELGPIEQVETVATAVLSLAFAVQLFRLRASAIPLLVVALVLSIVAPVWYALAVTNWVEAISAAGLLSIPLGWVVMVAILFYCRRLRARAVLT